MANMIRAPFTPEQIEALNAWQTDGYVHAFTCDRDHHGLVATEAGWVCPKCDYTQDWAHDFMVEPPNPSLRNDGDTPDDASLRQPR